MLNSAWEHGPIWLSYFSQWGCLNQLVKSCETTIPHSLATWILCHDHDIIWFGSTCIFRNIPAVSKKCTINSWLLDNHVGNGHGSSWSMQPFERLGNELNKGMEDGWFVRYMPLGGVSLHKRGVSIRLWPCWGKLHRKMIVLVIWNCRSGHWWFSWWNLPKIFCCMNLLFRWVSRYRWWCSVVSFPTLNGEDFRFRDVFVNWVLQQLQTTTSCWYLKSTTRQFEDVF